MLDLSIIIVNWNTWEYLQEAIRSVQEKRQNITYEIIVVDNGSNRDDGISEIEGIFPQVQLIRNEKNLGFSKANNLGLARAKGDYLLLLNADTVQVCDALDQSIKYMKANKEVGVLGIRHINPDGTKQDSWHSFPFFMADLKGLLGISNKLESRSEHFDESDVDWVCGSYFLISRECYQTVGNLDERYFIYDEDIDYCRRVWKAGFKVRYWGKTHFVHVGSGSGPRIRDKVYSNIRSRLTYYSQHLSLFHGFIFYTIVTLKWGMGIIRALFSRETESEQRKRISRWISWVFMRSSEKGIGSGVVL